MPTYEYICAKCGHEFELVQSISDNPLKICPKDLCAQKKWGKGPVKRKISAGGGLIFKGSGFYITDYRSDSYKEAAKKDKGETKPAASETKAAEGGNKEKSSDSGTKEKPKPAAKAESKKKE